MYREPIRRLQIDLVTNCNARCPFCMRQSEHGGENTFYPRNRELALGDLKKVLADPLMDNLEEVFLCGNYGDSFGTPRLLSYLDAVSEKNPRIRWNIHTNGSLGTPDLWKELAQRTQHHPRLVKFSLDGLADTNAIYRRGVNWERAMANAKLFIEHGGRAVWKFISFSHNAHQVEAARELAEQMGFMRFELRANHSPHLEPFLENGWENGSTNFDDELEVGAKLHAQTEIMCDSQKNASVFLDFDGRVWPCCWLPSWKYSHQAQKREWHERNVEEPAGGPLFNRISHRGLKEILETFWFSRALPESWERFSSEPGQKLHMLCAKKCGTCRTSTFSTTKSPLLEVSHP